jgi:major membrane immunogen (membrane-anchored lipoprotein)
MNKLTLDAWIEDNKIKYLDADYRNRIEKFKASHPDKRISMTLENADNPAHYLYKYYWGYLLPDLCFAMGEKNKRRIHIIMKRNFLMVNVCGLDEIPKKYFRQGVFRANYKDIMALEQGSLDIYVNHIAGIIVIENEGELFGYIPSNADISHDEMQSYVASVEHHLFVDLMGRLGEEGRDPAEAKKLRDKGMEGYEKQKEIFDGEDVTGLEKRFDEIPGHEI